MRRIWLTALWREVLLAVGLTIALELDLVLSDRFTAGRGAAVLLMTVPLAFRLRFPMTVLGLVVAGYVLEAALVAHHTGPEVSVISVLLALYAVGSRAGGTRVAVAAALTLVGVFAATRLRGSDLATRLVVPVLVTGCGLVIGRAVGVLRFESDVFAERASELERARDERARVAVAEERRRIARELHDVIGHSISVMGVQAGAVRSILREDQQREREALLGVERTGRQAIGEMRRLIGLLRTEPDDLGDPTPSLRRVEQLIREMREAGLAVSLQVHGDLAALSPGVDLAGYRIVQEALTNALKHAPGASVEATVGCNGQRLEIEVIDDGGTAPRRATGPVGHGLLGMRERASLYGGELVAGRLADGGFSICARIPLEVS